MQIDLSQELEKFHQFDGKSSNFVRIESAGPSILKINSCVDVKSKMTVGFLALVHGNETVGLPIINSLIESLLIGEQVVDYDIYFGLGNIPAALKDKRFLDEDLNRCFGRPGHSMESQRARQLEDQMLNHCDFLIDLHQTVSAAKDPFFIFQFSNLRCLKIINEINPGIPTILQFDQIGSATGLSTDEYMRSRSKWGTALELGQKGSTDYSQLGLEICKGVMEVLKPMEKYDVEPAATLQFPIYRLEGSFKAQDSNSHLDEGFQNLQRINKGQAIGRSEQGAICFPVDGIILFPRYRTATVGQELFYFASAMQTSDLQFSSSASRTDFAAFS
jgi:succinylglutamate desuccinylase